MTSNAEQTAFLKRWEAMIADPLLAPLPYKFELRGELIIMSPVPYIGHGYQQSKVAVLLAQHAPHGEGAIEAPVVVGTGVLVADAIWSATKLDCESAACFPSPDICVEIWSASNPPEEFARKRQLYFAAGAKEFWTVDKDGTLAFYVRLTDALGLTGACAHVAHSELIPTFPAKLV